MEWRDLSDHELTTPSTCGSSLVFSKNVTATSPVTTPMFSESASRNSCPNTRTSSGVRFKFGAPVYHQHPSSRIHVSPLQYRYKVVMKRLRACVSKGEFKDLTRVDIGVRHRARQRTDPPAHRALTVDFLEREAVTALANASSGWS